MILGSTNSLLAVAEVRFAEDIAWPTTNGDSQYTEAEHTADVDAVRARLESVAAKLAAKVRQPWVSRQTVRTNKVQEAGLTAVVTEPLASLIFGEVIALGDATLKRRKCYNAANVRNFCYVTSEVRSGAVLVTPPAQALALMYEAQAFLKGRAVSELNESEAEQYEDIATALQNNLDKMGPAWLDLQDAVALKGDYLYCPRSVANAMLSTGEAVELCSYSDVAAELPALATAITEAQQRAEQFAARFLNLDVSELDGENLMLTDITSLPWIKVDLSALVTATLADTEAKLLRTTPHIARGLIPSLMARTEGQAPLTNLQWANAIYYYAKGISRLAGVDPQSDDTAVSPHMCVNSFSDYVIRAGITVNDATPSSRALAICEALIRGDYVLGQVDQATSVEELVQQKLALWWLADSGATSDDLPEGLTVTAADGDTDGELDVTITNASSHVVGAMTIRGVGAEATATTDTAIGDFEIAKALVLQLDIRIGLFQEAANQSGYAKTTVDDNVVTLHAPHPIRNVLKGQYANLTTLDGTFVTPFMNS